MNLAICGEHNHTKGEGPSRSQHAVSWFQLVQNQEPMWTIAQTGQWVNCGLKGRQCLGDIRLQYGDHMVIVNKQKSLPK